MDEIINLPVYKAFNRIINSLGDRPNLILKSPTGSGKIARSAASSVKGRYN